MGLDITVKIGGAAGQGIQTVGNLLAYACHRAGLYIMAINDFESRIRGGHSFLQLRISEKPIHAPHHAVNLLVALNQRTYDEHHQEMAADGIILMDPIDQRDQTDQIDHKAGHGENRVVGVAFGELAVQAGGKITSNTVAAGACLSLMGAPPALFKSVLADLFAQKSEAVLAQNLAAARLGYEAVKKVSFNKAFVWQETKPRGLLLDGAKALALGALAGDCRMAAFYPMSPATGIMAHLNNMPPDFPLAVIQAEDELAAANMALGASFAGARSMTATSGGGFCLMTEALGLAGISETPLVIINAQRPGPATGLPTRTAQADLLFVIRASQDEFPRFVFAPGSAAEAFETMVRAFDLSEKYQVPAIVLVDQYFCDSLCIGDGAFEVPKTAKRHIAQPEDIPDPKEYKRYAATSSGVSPRALPCMGEALVVASGNEHDPEGHMCEEKSVRIQMVEKRHAKVPHMLQHMRAPATYLEESEILLVGWGSTAGVLKESVDMLQAAGVSAGCLHFCDLWPFPAEAASRILGNGRRFYMVEQNSTAQLGRLLRSETGLEYTGTVLGYDGRPFFPADIAHAIQQQLR